MVRLSLRIISVVMLLSFPLPWFFPSVNANFPVIKNLSDTATPKTDVASTPNRVGDFPQPPLRLMGSYGYSIHDFTAHGDYAYAIEGHRIRILSFADPTNTTIVTELFNPRPFESIQISEDGTRLFALVRGYYTLYQQDELLLYDVSDPSRPQLRSNLRASISEMHRYDNRLYIISNDSLTHYNHLQIYGWEGDTLTLLGDTRFVSSGDLFFDGNVLLVAGYNGNNSHENIALYDIADDSAPEFKRNIPTIGGVAIPLNGYLYVSNGDGGANGGYIDIWNIQDLDNPYIVQTIGTYIRPIATQGNLILASGNRFYDVSIPTDLRLVGQIEGFSFSNMMVWNEANEIYTLQYTNPVKLQRVLLTNEFEVLPQGHYTPPSQYVAVPVTDRYLYLFGTTPTGIDIHDMEDPSQPRLIANVLSDEFTRPPARDYHIVNQRLYVKREGDIAILDIRNPLAPVMVSTLPLGENWLLESVQNGYLFALRLNSNQIFALRLSDLVGHYIEVPDAGGCWGLDTEGTTLVLACDTLRVYDISNPTSPTLLGVLPTALSLLEPTLALPYLFVTTQTQLAIYDLSNPTMPQYVTSVADPVDPITVKGQVPSTTVTAFFCPELVALQPGYYLRQCYTNPQGFEVADIIDLRNPTASRRSESMYAPVAKGVVQGDTVVIASERFSVWQIRGILDKAVFVPIVQTP